MDTQSILDSPFSLDSQFSIQDSQTIDFSDNFLDQYIFNDCYTINQNTIIQDDSIASQSTLSTDSIINFDVLDEDINLDILLNEDFDLNNINSETIMDSTNDICFINDFKTNVSKPYNKNKKKMKQPSLLPYTIKDIKHNCVLTKASLNNEDLSKGRPGDKLYLSNEERQLLIREGYNIPTHLPLTKHEERALKSIRRKIRNKISAKNSRAKKESYVDGLEERIVQCSKENVVLKHKLEEVEQDKMSLFKQVLNLRKQLAKFLSDSPTSGTSLMLLLLTFMIILCPMLDPRQMFGKSFIQNSMPDNAKLIFPGRTRMLLQESEDSIELGEPYMVTIRVGPSWLVPPKTPAIPLKSINKASNISVSVVQPVVLSKNL